MPLQAAAPPAVPPLLTLGHSLAPTGDRTLAPFIQLQASSDLKGQER